MKILLLSRGRLPVVGYGGTERVVWWLAKALHEKGHHVSLMADEVSDCSFARTYKFDPTNNIHSQIPDDIDIVHSHFPVRQNIKKPYMVTIHGNGKPNEVFDKNTVFVSKNHAERHNSTNYVYNGPDYSEYGSVDWNLKRSHLLFLAQNRKEKNLKLSIVIAEKNQIPLEVIGTEMPVKKWYQILKKDSLFAHYNGQLGGTKKISLLNSSIALLFPVIWHEPFGLAIVESLYFGSPVIASNYGSIPELINKEVGFISGSESELIDSVKSINDIDRKLCHSYAKDTFNSSIMADNYLKYYEKVLNNIELNPSAPFSKITKRERLFKL